MVAPATLTLVRHAQASFGADDYDVLSALGVEQARVLGAALGRRLPRPHAVVTGTMVRHLATARVALEAMGVAAEPVPRPGFDELDHAEVIARQEPRYADPAILTAELRASADPVRAFHRVFTAALGRWMSGRHDADYREPWPLFKARRIAAVEELAREAPEGSSVLVVTSGGPIAVVVQHLLGLPDERMLRLFWGLANASLSKVVSDGRGLALASWNEHGHLEEEGRGLVTFR